MKAHLMYRDQDFDPQPAPPWNADELIADLELDTLLDAMAGGDTYLRQVAHAALLSPLHQTEAIHYRQDLLRDCLQHPAVIRDLYAIAVDAIDAEKHIYGGLLHSPDVILHHGVSVLEAFVDRLTQLRQVSDEHGHSFRSEGFTTFFTMLTKELGDDYFHTIQEHLRRLKFHHGVLISAGLDSGNKGTGYTLRLPHDEQRGWWDRLTNRRPGYSFTIPDPDEAGFSALSELRGRAINLAANSLAQSTDHILGFFQSLRAELGFHLACLNLHERLTAKSEPTCFPSATTDRVTLAGQSLYDVCLSLSVDDRVVGNDLDAEGIILVMITGANQGGKSTFLRALGLAQLMMQAGMFVGAQRFTANICSAVITHYKREEDPTMKSGKLDEELARMSAIADHIDAGSLLLCNESFAATNEREGSQIARQILRALLESGVKVVFVTHLFDLAHGAYQRRSDHNLFLRAERQSDGRRTFTLQPGEPLPTSFGQDVYEKVFAPAREPEDQGQDSRATSATSPESDTPDT